MLAGAAALAVADRAPRTRDRADATLLDAAVLGLAQACALWPGVSRSGATLAAARARRFTRPAAVELSVETGVPLLLGAAGFTLARSERGRVKPALTAARGVPEGRGPDFSRYATQMRPAVAGAAGSFVGTLLSMPLLRALRKPLWPWAVYRCGVALALVGRSGRG